MGYIYKLDLMASFTDTALSLSSFPLNEIQVGRQECQEELSALLGFSRKLYVKYRAHTLPAAGRCGAVPVHIPGWLQPACLIYFP